MTDDTPFLRTILDHPHEVGPRRVFADWLEERPRPVAGGRAAGERVTLTAPPRGR